MIEVDQRNPFGFFLTVSKSGAPCRSCTSVEVALLAAMAGTPETCELAMKRADLMECADSEVVRKSDAFVNASMEIMPFRTICGVCGHAEERNWHYIENPAVLPDGTVRHAVTPFPWEGWDVVGKMRDKP